MKHKPQSILLATLMGALLPTASANDAFAFGRSGMNSNFAGWSSTANTSPAPISYMWPPFISPGTVKPIAAGCDRAYGSLLLDVKGNVYVAGAYGPYGSAAASPGTYLPNLGNIIELSDSMRPSNSAPTTSHALKASGQVFSWGGATPQNPPALITTGVVPPFGVKQICSTGNGLLMLAGNGGLFFTGNWPGSLGNSNLVLPTPANLPVAIKQVSSGYAHGAALAADGRVMTWGLNVSNQVDPSLPPSGTTPPAFVKFAGQPIVGAKAIVCTYDGTAALLSDGTVLHWGAKYTKPVSRVNSAPGVPLAEIISMWGGRSALYMLRTDGVVFGLLNHLETNAYTLGGGPFAPAGYATAVQDNQSTPLFSAAPMKSGIIAGAGTEPSVFVRGRAKLVVAGTVQGLSNTPIWKLTPKMPSATVLVPPYGIRKWVQSHHSGTTSLGMGIDVHGRVFTVGNFNSFAVAQTSPAALDVACFNGRMLILQADGNLKFMGMDIEGLTGPPGMKTTFTSVVLPPLPAGVRIIKAKVVEQETFLLSADGQVWHLGLNQFDNSGTGNLGPMTGSNVKWRQVRQGSIVMEDVIDISISHKFGMALKANGEVFVWGTADSGQLGAGTSVPPKNSLSALQIPVMDPSGKFEFVKAISAGMSHCLALTSTGRAYGWGSTKQGELSTAGPIGPHLLYPTPLPGQFNGRAAKEIGAGNGATYILQATGALITCGINAGGQLGRPGAPQTMAQAQPFSTRFQSISVDFASRVLAGLVP